MSFFPRKLRKTLSGSMMVRIRHKLRYNRCRMLCYVYIGLFLEKTNPVVNPVVASQKLYNSERIYSHEANLPTVLHTYWIDNDHVCSVEYRLPRGKQARVGV